jgi:1-phosphofructokinase family hexose kinase
MASAAGVEIVCVTPNPALDRTLEVPRFKPGTILRAPSARVAAGGKGVNVARALAALGAAARCMGPLGGASGKILADLARAEGLAAAWTWCEGETRSCVILVDPEAKQATVINESGPRLKADDWNRVGAEVLAGSERGQTVSLSGSLPPGLPDESLAQLCRSLVEAGREVWADSSGPALASALSVRGVRMKINREEAEEVLGAPLNGVAACGGAARELLSRGPTTVVITLGADGAVLASAEGCWHSSAPPVESASAVASGDSFLAGLVAALTSGRDPAEALSWGVAAGTANAMANGGSRFSREQFDAILTRVKGRAVSR